MEQKTKLNTDYRKYNFLTLDLGKHLLTKTAASNKTGTIEGLVSVASIVDHHDHVISDFALENIFHTQDLSEVEILHNHDPSQVIGVLESLSLVKVYLPQDNADSAADPLARDNPTKTYIGLYAVINMCLDNELAMNVYNRQIVTREMSSFSIGFKLKKCEFINVNECRMRQYRFEKRPKGKIMQINEIELIEISIVYKPANPYAHMKNPETFRVEQLDDPIEYIRDDLGNYTYRKTKYNSSAASGVIDDNTADLDTKNSILQKKPKNKNINKHSMAQKHFMTQDMPILCTSNTLPIKHCKNKGDSVRQNHNTENHAPLKTKTLSGSCSKTARPIKEFTKQLAADIVALQGKVVHIIKQVKENNNLNNSHKKAA